LYVDNGSIYTSQEITLICARVGCILRHTPVRDGSAKGKVERFFRRVRQQFLSRNLDLSSLDKLNEESRKVKKDNTFSFKNVRYETPVDLRDKQITIRFDRSNYDRIVIYYKNQRMGEAKPLDPIANGLLRRKDNQS
jgi:transposase InsO family protein